jgi:hypothetical protein
MPFGGLVVNRLHPRPDLDGELPAGLDGSLRSRVLSSAHELAALADSDAAAVERLKRELDDPPVLIVPERAEDDVHDVEGLAHVRAHLWASSTSG